MMVVVVLPEADLLPGISQAREQHLVEELVAEAAVEALDEAVLHRLARRDVVPVDASPLAPGEDCHRGQLRPVVRDNHLRSAAKGDQRVELAGDAVAGQRGVGDQGQALPTEVIDHRQHPEPTPVREGITDKIEAPAPVHRVRHQHRPPCAERPLAATSPAHLEPLFAVEPPQLLEVHHDPLPSQHDVQAPVAEPTPLCRNRLHRSPRCGIVRAHASVAYTRPIHLARA